MKKFGLLIPFCIASLSCATLTRPTRSLNSGQAGMFKKQFENSELQNVVDQLGAPLYQGHWGPGEHSFLISYPVSNDSESSSPSVTGNEKDRRCYVFRFDKENNNKFLRVEERPCLGFGSEPERVDWDYVKPQKLAP